MKLFLFLMNCKSLLVVLFIASGAVCADSYYEFASAEHEQRFNRLNTELRCLVCQNQSLADSDAELAQDLRSIVYTMIQNGQTDQAIRDYMVARYGQYVLYKPPLGPATYLLWFGPVIFLLFSVIGLIIFVRNHQEADADSIDDADRKRLKSLMDAK